MLQNILSYGEIKTVIRKGHLLQGLITKTVFYRTGRHAGKILSRHISWTIPSKPVGSRSAGGGFMDGKFTEVNYKIGKHLKQSSITRY